MYYKVDDSDFTSETREEREHFIDIAENVGHAVTFKILTDVSKKVINYSNSRSAGITLRYNFRLDPLYGESKQFIKSKSENMQLYNIDEPQVSHDDENKLDHSENMTDSIPLVEPIDLVGRSCLLDTEDGEKC